MTLNIYLTVGENSFAGSCKASLALTARNGAAFTLSSPTPRGYLNCWEVPQALAPPDPGTPAQVALPSLPLTWPFTNNFCRPSLNLTLRI